MARRRPVCGAALAIFALAVLVSPALALKWQRVSSVPANGFISGGPSSPPKLAMWRSEGGAVGLLALQEPTPAQYLTTDGGSTWSKISNHFITSVYMVGNTTALATGQLKSQRSAAKPDAVLMYKRFSNSWSVTLSPPMGAAGITVRQVEVTDGGKIVFLLGSLLFKDKQGALSPIQADGSRVQHIWRYNVATKKWDILRTVKSSPNAQGRMSQSIASISASNGSALWASWEGALANGASAAGLVTFYNGAAWSTARSSNGQDAVRQLKAVGSQVFATVVQAGTATVQNLSGGKWVNKLTATLQNGFFMPATAPSANFALLPEGGVTAQGVNAARLWRWNGATAAFSNAWNITGTGTISDVVLDAYSDQRAVAAGVFDMRRIVSRHWFNNKWSAVDTLQCAPNVVCAVSNLVALPGGSALLTLVGSGGVWRLVA